MTLAIHNVGKAYRTYASEWQRFAGWFGLRPTPKEEHWVLRNINFEIQAGQAIGILGQNGAGKSTLLKIITGTLSPSEGAVIAHGRIGAILELGMGFNPELTGRQNVTHTAGLMGYGAERIDELLPEIEAFADIGSYFEQPVRVYSSGMQARVAFALATAVRPEILIVDEVLAVGDAAFQRKSFRRIEEFMEKGTILLFVSHDIESVKRICDKALHLKSGRQLEFGDAKTVCDSYEKALFGRSTTTVASLNQEPPAIIDNSLNSDCEVVYGDGRATIEAVWLENNAGERANVFNSEVPLRVLYRVRATHDIDNPIYACMIKTREGIALFGTDSEQLALTTGLVKAGDSLTIVFILESRLAPGTYYLNCGIRDSTGDKSAFIHRRVDTVIFKITADSTTTVASGLVDLKAALVIERSA